MRGLDIRVAFVMAKLALITDPTREDLFFVLMDAQAQGWYDEQSGETLPVMFADEPMLREAWMLGAKAAEIDDEIASCHCCNDGTGDPCPLHD
ncbi:hypothetical protein [Burkholderia gladioli]|uniref:hypothetical protein n=1 Tax=Burkholderia gladioli TaxID=28095 RepID=UPI001640CCDA|nr:hypothetical protein [Burkholderia gladioli]MDN7742387.1 hypothetical protein [Burkholderia gladioli]